MKFRSTGLPLVSCLETIARGAKIADLIAIGGTVVIRIRRYPILTVKRKTRKYV